MSIISTLIILCKHQLHSRILKLLTLLSLPFSRVEDINIDDNKEVDFEEGFAPSLTSIRTWKKYMNPASWFTGTKNSAKSTIMAISIIFYLVIGSVVFFVISKILATLNCIRRQFRRCKSCLGCCCGNEEGHGETSNEAIDRGQGHSETPPKRTKFQINGEPPKYSEL